MVMMGNRNWFMPRWLDRVVPHLSIEGAEFFERRDRESKPRPEPVPAGAAAGPE